MQRWQKHLPASSHENLTCFSVKAKHAVCCQVVIRRSPTLMISSAVLSTSFSRFRTTSSLAEMLSSCISKASTSFSILCEPRKGVWIKHQKTVLKVYINTTILSESSSLSIHIFYIYKWSFPVKASAVRVTATEIKTFHLDWKWWPAQCHMSDFDRHTGKSDEVIFVNLPQREPWRHHLLITGRYTDFRELKDCGDFSTLKEAACCSHVFLSNPSFLLLQNKGCYFSAGCHTQKMNQWILAWERNFIFIVYFTWNHIEIRDLILKALPSVDRCHGLPYDRVVCYLCSPKQSFHLTAIFTKQSVFSNAKTWTDTVGVVPIWCDALAAESPKDRQIEDTHPPPSPFCVVAAHSSLHAYH